MTIASCFKALACVFAAPLFALSGAARAADGDKPTYELGLYLWGASMAANVDTDQFDESVHISLSDVLENLNVSVMARARANFDKLSVVFDGEFIELESDKEQKSVRVGPGPGVELTGTVKAKLQSYILELNTGYEVLNVRGPFPAARSEGHGTRGELYLGGRYYAMKPELEIRGPFGESDPGEWVDFVDGVVGARVFTDLTRTVAFGVQGDVGGFNIGNSSDLSWSQITSLSWRFSESATLAVGYKFLDVRKTHDHTTLDLQIRGPFLATFFAF